MAERSMSELEIDEAEQGSSEKTLEGVTNVSTKSFSHIASCQLLTQKALGNRENMLRMTNIVLLPDGQAVIALPIEGQLKILAKDMETKLHLNMKRQFNFMPFSIFSVAMALFDRKCVAVAMCCAWQRTTGEQEEMTYINIVSVSQSVQLGPEIKRKYRCEKITCFNKQNILLFTRSKYINNYILSRNRNTHSNWGHA